MDEIKKVSEWLIRLRQLDQENIKLITPDNRKTKAYTEEVRELVKQLQERYFELMERRLQQ
ncbi:MAG: hypothetical protein JNK26_04115 [Candidatus Doudnabacteria bacterium]|nr:hypothetical protein [Candidatus Doudnabacteria bacterium]